jgi:hypothetical protein
MMDFLLGDVGKNRFPICYCHARSCAPLGRVAVGGRFPGLKPRAESCSPFGAKTVPTPPYLSAIRDRSNIGRGVYFIPHFYLLFCVVCFTPLRFRRVKAEGQNFLPLRFQSGRPSIHFPDRRPGSQSFVESHFHNLKHKLGYRLSAPCHALNGPGLC